MHGMTEQDRMYSVRQAPWHIDETNSFVLDGAPETRMARIMASGQNWLVEPADVFLAKKRLDDPFSLLPVYQQVEGWKALQRSDNGLVLNVAKDSYEVVQNVVGHELFEALSQGAALDDGSGGTIKSGAVCYLSARLDEPSLVEGDTSPTYPYVVVTWTHDGSGALTARRTNIRVVCWNTLSMSEAESRRSGRFYTFRHTKSVLERVDEAKRVISGLREEHSRFMELANELVKVPVDEDVQEEFIRLFIPAPPTTQVISDRVLDNITNERAKVRAIFGSDTMPEAHRDTAWGLVQAGVEYLDHLRGYRSSDTYLNRTLLRDEPLKAKLIPQVLELVGQK